MGNKCGINPDTGTPEQGIAGCSLAMSGNGVDLSLTDPIDGRYPLQFKDGYTEDFQVLFSYADDKEAIQQSYWSFTEGDTQYWNFDLAASSDARLVVNRSKMIGTAKNGMDYKRLSGKVIIPIGKTGASLYIAAINDRIKKLKETVKVNLVKKAYYHVGTPASATVTIADND